MNNNYIHTKDCWCEQCIIPSRKEIDKFTNELENEYFEPIAGSKRKAICMNNIKINDNFIKKK
jgi:hypothetical protein